MLIEHLTTDSRYQFRTEPFSQATVDGILAEGLNPAKFDPIPVIQTGPGIYVVAGDGHSRLEAVRQLAAEGLLPEEWRRGGSWDVPTRQVEPEEALQLAYTANMGRADFTAVEEARIFRARVDLGESLEAIAATSHRTTGYVKRSLSLLELCREIQQMVEVPADLGGIDRTTAHELAIGFKRYNVSPAQQRDLWRDGLQEAGLNHQSAKRFIEQFGKRLALRRAAGRDGEMLFQLPVNACNVVAESKVRVRACRRAKTGLQTLMKAMEEGGLTDYPGLSRWLRRHGERAISNLGEEALRDGDLLARFAGRSG